MSKNKFIFCLTLALHDNLLHPVTLVYNLRIRRSFDIPAELRGKFHWLVSAIPIISQRKSHIVQKLTGIDVHEKRLTGGSLFNMRYMPNQNWWFEATTALLRDSGTYTGTNPLSVARTGFDDLVFAGGYRFFTSKKTQVVPYVIAGFPLRSQVTPCDTFGPLVGTRLYNLGAGLEASYNFYSSEQRSCSAMVQGRCIHGFDRCWTPAGARIQPGNFSDILVAFQFREKLTVVEIGYDATIFSNQALFLKTPPLAIKTNTFVRNSGYINAYHGWLKGLFGKPFVLSAGFIASHTKQFNARTYTAFISGTVVF